MTLAYWTNRGPLGKNGHLEYLGINPDERRRSRYLARFVSDMPKESKILEIGCGCGRNLWYLMRAGYVQVYGTEPHEEKAKIAGLTTGRPVANIGIGEDIPFVDLDTFDLVFTMAVLMHIEDDAAIKAITRTNPRRILTLEAETMKKGPRHFPRNYRDVFEGSRRWKQIGEWVDLPGFGESYVGRLFRRV